VHFACCCCFFFFRRHRRTFSFLGINATPIDNDMRTWNALIDGPTDTCYEDGLFTLRMEFSGKTKTDRFGISCLLFRDVSIDTANRSIYM